MAQSVAATGSATQARAWLVPLSGPPLLPLELNAGVDGATIGRHEQCAVRLPLDADKVSRFHVRLSVTSRGWRIADLGSRWGTWLNGVKLDPNRDMPLTEGDLIRITPWTFSFSTHGPVRRGLKSSDDANTSQTLVRRLDVEPVTQLADNLLTLLLESAAAVHAARDERALAETILDAAVRGTGLPNAALLRPLDNSGTIEIIASRRSPADEHSPVFSRSLINTASQGVVAELQGAVAGDVVSQSIVQMRIDTALCVPLLLGATEGEAGTVAAYLYLDSRMGRSIGTRLRHNASAFCQALGRMASLALANLKRIDIERRQAAMEAELSAASAAQKWIMPGRESSLHQFTCIGESRPGAYLGGDFFDLIELSPTKLAVALGDVTGHGVAASVLMTATQGFLHAALSEHGDPERAVTELNKFVHPRRSSDKFITLWLGVFDAEARILRYVDAGHGYALLIDGDGAVRRLDEGDGLPIGLMPDREYRAAEAPLAPGGRALIISDGIAEQFGLVTGSDGSTKREQFDVHRVEQCLVSCPTDHDVVAELFQAVERHAGTTTLQDDATAVLVKW